MPVKNPRINVVLEKPLYHTIEQLANRDGVSLSLKVRDLVKEALEIEGTMRGHIQRQRASYFFIGSRRRVLLGIFNERQRPFFQSAINYPLKTLPADEL